MVRFSIEQKVYCVDHNEFGTVRGVFPHISGSTQYQIDFPLDNTWFCLEEHLSLNGPKFSIKEAVINKLDKKYGRIVAIPESLDLIYETEFSGSISRIHEKNLCRVGEYRTIENPIPDVFVSSNLREDKDPIQYLWDECKSKMRYGDLTPKFDLNELLSYSQIKLKRGIILLENDMIEKGRDDLLDSVNIILRSVQKLDKNGLDT